MRATRVRPGLDDKVLADWNGLMIAALTNAGLMFGEPTWLDMAARAFDFVARAMSRGDRLGHSWRAGQLKFPGLASDFAAMIRAALALHEATGEQKYLDQALAWQRALDRDYANKKRGRIISLLPMPKVLSSVPLRRPTKQRPITMRSPAGNLIRLALLAGDDAWRDKADHLIAAIAPQAIENLYMHMALLNAIDLRLRAAEIVVTGEGAAATPCSRPHGKYRRSTVSCCMRPRPHCCRPPTRHAKSSPRDGGPPLSALVKRVPCLSPIRPASLAPWMRRDILHPWRFRSPTIGSRL